MKQFNLVEYLKNPSKKIITRDGRNARIICTNRECACPIVALVKKYGPTVDIVEEIYTYPKSGMLMDGVPSDDDLFFVPEKHEGWINIYHNSEGAHYVMVCPIFESKEEAEKVGNECSGYITTSKIEWEDRDESYRRHM